MQLEKITEMMLDEGDDSIRVNYKAQYHYITKRANALRKELKWMKDNPKVKADKTVNPETMAWELRAFDDLIYVMKRRAEQMGVDLKA